MIIGPEIIQQSLQFEEAYKATKQIFGPDMPFRKWLGSKYESRFNRAIFDIMVFYFSEARIRNLALQNGRAVEDEFKRLCIEDSSFLGSIERTTKSLDATCLRLATWATALNKVLSLKLHVPYLENNRIKL